MKHILLFSILFPRDGNGWIWHVEKGLPLPFVRWMKHRLRIKEFIDQLSYDVFSCSKRNLSQDISSDPRDISRVEGNLEGRGNGFPNTSQVLVEYRHSPHQSIYRDLQEIHHCGQGRIDSALQCNKQSFLADDERMDGESFKKSYRSK